ncbi:MAG: hypothetical protein GY757_05795, partial [bacterium]|nr:hypothetical protein [bacterium]
QKKFNFKNGIVNSIIEFLDSKNVDTSDLKEKTSTILNSGVIISGGAMTAENITVGEKAKSIIKRFSNTSKSKKRW